MAILLDTLSQNTDYRMKWAIQNSVQAVVLFVVAGHGLASSVMISTNTVLADVAT